MKQIVIINKQYLQTYSPPSKSAIFFETYTFIFWNLYGVFGACVEWRTSVKISFGRQKNIQIERQLRFSSLQRITLGTRFTSHPGNAQLIRRRRTHTRLTMYYIRPFQYDCTSRWLYVLVLVILWSVLVTSREYTCIFTFYTLPWRWTVCKFQKRKKWGKAFYSVHPYGTICFLTADRKLDLWLNAAAVLLKTWLTADSTKITPLCYRNIC